MAITQAIPVSYRKEILTGTHSSSHSYKIALYTTAASLGIGTSSFSTTNEVVGAGYVSGGSTMSVFTISTDGDTVIVDFTNDPNWTSASITAGGALIYNNTVAGNPAVLVLDFGAAYTATNGTFTVVFPAATAAAGLMRISS